MSLPRAIMDTNVLYSGLRSQRGASFSLLRALRAGRWQLVLSNTLLAEYEEVLSRNQSVLGLDRTQVADVLDALCAAAEKMSVPTPWTPLSPDADDEAILQLAKAARTEYIVTHNTRHFTRAAEIGVQVMQPGAFMAELRAQS